MCLKLKKKIQAEYTKHVEILTPGAQEWVLAEELPTYRLFTAMTTLGDKPFLIGGGEVTDSGWIYHDSILMYNTSSMAFQDTGKVYIKIKFISKVLF